MNIDFFDYAPAPPHTITLCRPSASEKTVVDIEPCGITFSRAHHTPREDVPLTWVRHPIDLQLYLEVAVEGTMASFSRWHRHESGAPAFLAAGESSGVSFSADAIAGKTGVWIRLRAKNESASQKTILFQLSHIGGWVISNKGWIDGIHSNLFLQMNEGPWRADTVLALGFGADEYPITRTGDVDPILVPGSTAPGVRADSKKKITSLFRLGEGEEKSGFLLLPYKALFADLEKLEALDPEKETAAALKEWQKLLRRGAQFEIEDEMLLHCQRAALADLFVMRERIGRYTGITCGTRMYRSMGSGESLESETLLDTLGFEKEAVADYPLYLEGQDPNGCWAASWGWEHDSWGVAFMKANAVMEHYYITRDRDFLEQYYARMYRSTMFNHQARQTTKQLPELAARGLMPRGIGDCGMMNGDDYYGYFYPANAQAVAADGLTIKAAEILGRDEDLPRLRAIYEEAKEDLLASIRSSLVSYGDYEMMPAMGGVPVSSLYGCMFPFFPAKIVDGDEPFIRGAVRFIEEKRVSEGGLPLGTGWLENGLWIAMALGSIARTYLRLGLYGEARKYLSPALRHASPLMTYCEERGAERGTATKTGDRQHLWTPLSVCQYLADAFWFEDEQIHLLSGILPEWVEGGKTAALRGLCTHYGKTDIVLSSEGVSVKTERPMEKDILFLLPDGGDKAREVLIEARGKTEVSYRFTL